MLTSVMQRKDVRILMCMHMTSQVGLLFEIAPPPLTLIIH